MRAKSWMKHLKNRRGSDVVKQMWRMWNFHRTSFHDLLTNIFDALDPYDAKFTFPTVASVTPYQPDNIYYIMKEGHEIANHGYKHVKYPFLSNANQEREFQLSQDIFNQYNIPIKGFRAPYNSYNETTIQLVQKYKFSWDGGIGYLPEYRKTNSMFYYKDDTFETDFVSIPCHRYSDDLLIDSYRMDPENIEKLWKAVIRQAAKTGGVVMFDLHPIRIGQQKYAKILREMVDLTNNLNGWMPNVYEATEYWREHGKWPKGYDFCFLLTGDIDNFVFFDYFRRLN